jgi:hypothetical protein
LYERRGVELPKLRLLLLLFGVNVFRGVVLVELLENERCVLGRVAVERVLLCLPLPKVRVRFCVVPFPKDRVPLFCSTLERSPLPKVRVPLLCCTLVRVPVPKLRVPLFCPTLERSPLPKVRVPLFCCMPVRVPFPKLRLLSVELRRVPRPKSPRLNPSRIPTCVVLCARVSPYRRPLYQLRPEFILQL